MSSRRMAKRHLGIGIAALVAVAGVAVLLAKGSGGEASAPDELAQDVREARLEAAVHIALLEKLRGDGLRVAVEVRGDEIILSGTVKSRASQELAGEVALAVC